MVVVENGHVCAYVEGLGVESREAESRRNSGRAW